MQESVKTSSDESSIDEIVAELDQEYSGVLPEQALRAAQGRREEMTPRLIQLIEAATAMVRSGEKVRGDGHLFALYLLAEFQAKEALPAIIEAVSLPGDGPFDLFGDMISEDLNRILAILAADAPATVEELIADRSLNEYVRSAASEVSLFWVRDGRLSREQAVERLREHLKSAVAHRDEYVAGSLVAELLSFAPTEALEEINKAFEQDLVDPMYINEDNVKESLARGESAFREALEYCPPTTVEDTVEELSSWHCYQPKASSDDRRFGDEDLFEDAWESNNDAAVGGHDTATTIRNALPKVGRNESCPCGSGKKFKKCCGKAT